MVTKQKSGRLISLRLDEERERQLKEMMERYGTEQSSMIRRCITETYERDFSKVAKK